MGLIGSIKRDIQAVYMHDPAARNILEVLFAYPGFHAHSWHRVAHTLWKWHVPFLPRLISHVNRFFTGIEIHPGARIGEGLFIDHGMGVVIGETAEIGDNVVLYQGVTLGGTSTRREKRHPTLGNNVVVGAGAKLIGAIVIGDNTKVGAGSVVVCSAPSNATIVGVPGRVLEIRNPDTDTVERLPDPVGEKLDYLENRIALLETILSIHFKQKEIVANLDKALSSHQRREEMVADLEKVINSYHNPEELMGNLEKVVSIYKKQKQRRKVAVEPPSVEVHREDI